ncbi:MAG: hypothetical protein HC915_13100 [Anaerolineae bacterium]|nr:hypothetical protein [Anaerolineae bacterium]
MPPPEVTLPPALLPTATPSLVPTRPRNPDAVIGQQPSPLLSAPSSAASTGELLAPLTALLLEGRTLDLAYFQVRLLDGRGSGWVSAADVVLFGDPRTVPLASAALPGPAEALLPDDLINPPRLSPENEGRGPAFVRYDYAACGETYWLGDGPTFSMEDFAFQGRYPRFAQPTIRLYVYYGGEPDPALRDAWEGAVVHALAQLSQVLQIERVQGDDLAFFQPVVPMQTLLAESQVDLVWHILPRADFEQAAPCQNPFSCALLGLDGAVRGGPLRFSGATYLPNDLTPPRRQAALLHTALHALGLWIHSANPIDVLYPNSANRVLSARDVNTLRCLYAAPPLWRWQRPLKRGIVNARARALHAQYSLTYN